jgi:hypothetical protein
MRRPLLALACVGLAFSLTPGLAAAQQAPAHATVFWTVSSFQVPFSKVDSLMKLTRAYTLPAVEEAKKAGALLDYRVLIHSWAGRDNVVILRAYSSWDAIHNDTTFGAAARRLQPDSAKRRMVNEAFNEIFGTGIHHDEIYQEITK